MIVYLLTSPSGKHYVGITSKTLEKRWYYHIWEANKGSMFAIHKAIRKYGSESFKAETIETVETWDEACAREKFWIAWIGTRPPFGYNLTDGGDGTLGVKVSAETREKLSKAGKGNQYSLGFKQSEETKAKLAEAGRGRKHSDETREKMSSAQKGRPKSEEHVLKMTGRKNSAESIQRMSEAAKRRKPASSETREKMSAAQKARFHRERNS